VVKCQKANETRKMGSLLTDSPFVRRTEIESPKSYKGCRPLNSMEYRKVIASFRGINRCRNRCLFAVGCKTGFRISELLSVRVGDVLESGRVRERLTVRRENMKNKRAARGVVIRPELRPMIRARIAELRDEGFRSSDTFLFKAAGAANRPISRVEAWMLLKKAYARAGLTGPGLATHTMRKSFALRIHRRSHGDIRKVQRALGHEKLDSTAAYMRSITQGEIDRLILSM
jgi:integrase